MQSMGLSLSKLIKSETVKKVRILTQTAFSTKYLLLTNVGISISLSAVGDTIEQNYEILTEQLEKYSPKRSFHMSVSGMTIGVMCHFWYKYLDRKMPGRLLTTVFKKVLVDQFVGSPICITTFFLTLSYLEKSSWEELYNEIKNKAWKLYVAEWVVWPPAQAINFYVLPTKYRVLYDNTISLGYDIYTSHVKHDPKKLEDKKETES